MLGKIYNIQRFCINDGPGIRTLVFFKGCPLKCVWCHNPESQNIESEMMYYQDKCINCLRCVDRCPRHCHIVKDGQHKFRVNACIGCGECIPVGCKAMQISGYEKSVEDIIKEVLRDKPFYDNSGGGITLTGGEPLYQEDFCIELLRQAKAKDLHIAMETCGFASMETVRKSAEYVDLYLFDLKETNPQKHKEFTGVDNELILANLKMLDDMGKSIVLRCPIIPTLNDCDAHLAGIASIANSLKNIQGIEIEPYHSYGAGKYAGLSRDYKLWDIAVPDEDTVNCWIEKIQSKTDVLVRKA